MVNVSRETGRRIKLHTARRETGSVGAKVRRHARPGGGESEWIRFTLNEDIASDDTGLVTVVESMSSLEVGDIVTALNGTPNTGLQNAVGEAVKANGEWVAILIATPAQFVAATATSHSHNWAGSSGSPTTSMPSAVTTLTISSPVYPSPWPNDHDVSLPVKNPYGYFWRSGATLLLMYSIRDGGCYEVVQVTQGPLRVKFKLNANATNELNPSIAATAILPLTDIGIMPSIAITVIDRYCRCHNAKTNDMGTADLNMADGTWEVNECDHVATELMGQLTGSGFSGTPSDITVTQVYGLNGRSPNASMSSTMTIKNRFAWASGVANGKIYFKWDAPLGQYFAVQMTCP
jgi:hypothetical protein